MNVPHLLVSIDDSQRDEIVVLNTLTLTEEQWKTLREVAPHAPKRFQGVVPITFTDAEDSFNAIQVSTNKVALIYSQFNDPKNVEPLNILATNFTVDQRGQFYRWNELIHFNRLLEIIADYKPDTKNMNDDLISITLPVGAKLDDDVYHDRIIRLQEATKKVGLGISVNGIAQQDSPSRR